MFCRCGADYQDAQPNTRVCPVCLAMPGVLPVVNRRAVEWAIKIGLALNCKIARVTKFDRKNYPYPDLMKGYQISQYDVPIAFNGGMDLRDIDGAKEPVRIGINRVHMEEDVARLVHVPKSNDGGYGYTLMDVNRAGVPLMEVVSEPDIRSAGQAEAYILNLQSIIRYLGVGAANMEEGSFRCDANGSVRPKGSQELWNRVEVKNMNRVRAGMRAIEYECDRQINLYRTGKRVKQETRGWDDDRKITVSHRSKEEAHDYRYFPEPDLPPLDIDDEWVEAIRTSLPEMPQERRLRFQNELGLSEYDAGLLTAERSTADYFELVLDAGTQQSADLNTFAKETANWLNGEMARLLNADQTSAGISAVKIRPENLAQLVDMFRKRQINNATAKEVFREMFNTGRNANEIVIDRKLMNISDNTSLEPVVAEVINSNPVAVNDYLVGKDAAIQFLLGQVMKATRGQADAKVAISMLKEQLVESKTS